jgi:hypothetical protein
MNTLREAMAKTDIVELEAIADTLGRQAVEKALADDEARVEHLALEDRQRQDDAALADAVEAVSRQRARLGRRVCTRTDAAAVRLIFDTLRRMLSQADTSDPGFPS